MRKAETQSLFLPHLKTKFGKKYPSTQTQRSHNKTNQMRSMFVQKVKEQTSKATEYEHISKNDITQQQKKLKSLLREFNQETYDILGSYLDNPIKGKLVMPKKYQKTRSTSEITQINDQEISNKKKIIQQCQKQINSLENRCENLKYTTREEMETRIFEIKDEIEKAKGVNKYLARNVTLNGLDIVRGQKFDKIKEMDYEKVLVDQKKADLSAIDQQIQAEIESLKNKCSQSDKQINQKEASYSEAIKSENEILNRQKLSKYQSQKKARYQIYKHKNQQIDSKLKHRYFIMLQQIEQSSVKSKKYQQEHMKVADMLERTKKDLVVYEHKASAMKKDKVTVHLLEKDKK